MSSWQTTIDVHLLDSCRSVETPFYFLHLFDFIQRYNLTLQTWRQYFPNAAVAYSFKTNPIAEITRVVSSSGGSADVASLAELEWALEDGFREERIHFNGPSKTIDELQCAVRAGANIHIDSLDEVEKIATIRSQHRRPRLILRVAPILPNGLRSRFGFTRSEYAMARNKLASCGLELSGMHFHVASKLQSTAFHVRTICEFSQEIRELIGTGKEAPTLSIGGGYPVECLSPSGPVQLEHFARSLVQVFSVTEIPFRNCNLVVEPGRSLTEPIGFLVVTVAARKSRDGRKLLFVNGGTNLARSATAGARDCWVIGAPGVSSVRYTVFGPLCYETDVLVWDLGGPLEVPIGANIAVGSVGAYDIALGHHWGGRHASVIVQQNDLIAPTRSPLRLSSAKSAGGRG